MSEVEPVAKVPVSEIVAAAAGYIVAQSAEVQTGVEATVDPAQGAEEPVGPLLNGALPSILECLLFVSTEPLSARQLAETLGVEDSRIEEAMAVLEDKLEAGRGLQLMRVAGSYQLCTRPEYADYRAVLLQPAKKKLSKAALETLAVVAYRQTCTMPEIEAVRGVSVDGVMKTLMERGLVKEAGHKQTPGYPKLYATTPEFLEYFGLNDISELPDIDVLAVDEIKALQAQKALFVRDAGHQEAGA